MKPMRRALGLLAIVLVAWVGDGCRVASHPTPPRTAKEGPAASGGADSIYSASALPSPDLGYNAREGRALYRHYCLNCHGEAGKGDGFNAYNLDPKPRSLADSSFQAQRSDSDFVVAIRSGGAAVGLSNGMPPWGRTLPERQIQNVVAYLRTLPSAP
ncbi:MAG: c-type cytochrome [Bacteroidota bacterium]